MYLKHSIRVRLTLILATCIICVIVGFCVVNVILLPNFYEYSKINMLNNIYKDINEIYLYDEDLLSQAQSEEKEEEVQLKLERLGSKKNLSLYISNATLNGTIIFREYKYPTTLNKTQKKDIDLKLKEYYLLELNDKLGTEQMLGKELLSRGNNYNIYKTLDDRIESYYIELYGKLDNGYTIYTRTNFDSIQESVNISNRFLKYIGIIAVLIAMIVMYFISKSFTKPILELAEIAKKMSNLDFEVRYNLERYDEIGVLGKSINDLSQKLETTISELKTANNELQSDVEQKIQIDEMRKDFISNVSHELKTPIALIQGYAEGLKENINEDEESREFYCDVIIDEAYKMNKMVKKLLTLNQIEFGNTQINFERFDIVSLVKSVLISTDIMFKQKEVCLHFEQKEPIYVWADEYMIEEVVTNYISNALNHVDGAKIIEIKMIKMKDVVRVAVFNTGNNIPESDLDKIWIKFYKVDKARTREYGGSGIGLSIVKAIMSSMNKECGVVNRKTGVEFWFELDTKS